MKKIAIFLLVVSLFSCNENYSNGERIGLITQFSRTGNVNKSWEGHLNATQTGMNSSQPFDFSIDNDNEPDGLVKTLDSAAQFGWKVKITYHETFGKNWWHNRGHTDFFVTRCDVLDKMSSRTNIGVSGAGTSLQYERGKVIDTIYVVIDKSK